MCMVVTMVRERLSRIKVNERVEDFEEMEAQDIITCLVILMQI